MAVYTRVYGFRQLSIVVKTASYIIYNRLEIDKSATGERRPKNGCFVQRVYVPVCFIVSTTGCSFLFFFFVLSKCQQNELRARVDNYDKMSPGARCRKMKNVK